MKNVQRYGYIIVIIIRACSLSFKHCMWLCKRGRKERISCFWHSILRRMLGKPFFHREPTLQTSTTLPWWTFQGMPQEWIEQNMYREEMGKFHIWVTAGLCLVCFCLFLYWQFWVLRAWDWVSDLSNCWDCFVRRILTHLLAELCKSHLHTSQ